MLFLAVPLALIGARAYYCIFYWERYAESPISCLYVWEGGLAIYGGIIGAVLGVLIISKIKKISPLNYLDIGALGLLIGQSILKLVLVGRQICDSGHIDGDNAHASGALAGTEKSSGLLAQFPQIQTQSAAHTADITGLHVRIDIIGKIRCTVFCGHLE